MGLLEGVGAVHLGACRKLMQRRGEDMTELFELVEVEAFKYGVDLFIGQDGERHGGGGARLL